VFGVGAARKAADWRSIVRQLVASGFLQIDVGGYGGLGVTDRGRALAGGDETFMMRPQPAARKPDKAVRKDKERAIATLDADQARLLEKLKRLRLDLAHARGVPPYVIFHDRTLMELAERQPVSRAAFAQIHGVGEAKLQNFAEPFLDLIQSQGANQ
jgi:ATP-dependent DNA helicase RecQ